MSVTAYDRILGCLLGGAVGDGIGYEVEFKSLDEILALRGVKGVTGPSGDGPIEVSDDSQMTLFTLEGLTRAVDRRWIESARAIAEIREGYLDWYGTQHRPTDGREPKGRLASIPSMRKAQAPGATCLTALAAGGNGTEWTPINDSKGCGGVMRSAPCGFVEIWSPMRAYGIGAASGALTHGHYDGFGSAGAMAMMIRMIMSGASLNRAAEAAIRAAERAGARSTAALLDKARRAATGSPRLLGDELTGELGLGWTGDEALAVGYYAAAISSGFMDAITVAATHSGDSDSTASITGQLHGARDGISAVPMDLWSRLDILEPIRETARSFCEAVGIEVPRNELDKAQSQEERGSIFRRLLPFLRR